MARPKVNYKTIQKTWMFFESDVNAMLDLGVTPKEVFARGIRAHQHGWSPVQDTDKIEDMKKRIQHIAWVLDGYVTKFNMLARLVHRVLKVDIDESVSTKELENKLKELEEQEEKLNNGVNKSPKKR